MPSAALRDALERLRPAVVVIWAHHADLAAAVPIEELGRSTDAVLVAAGPGWEGLALPAPVRRPATLAEAVGLVLDPIAG